MSPTNLIRLLTGSGMGLVVAFMIYPAFNQSVWKDPDMKPALVGVKDVGGLDLVMPCLSIGLFIFRTRFCCISFL